METTALARARRVLLEAGYSGTELARRLHTGSVLHLPTAEMGQARLLLDLDSRLDVLAALLLLGDELAEATAREALGADLDVFADAGLVERDSGTVRPLVQVIPHDDLLIASDRLTAEPDAGFVPGVQAPSDLLARLTPRDHVARALDVGTGCGIQAVLLRRHAGQVVATDVNPRALDMAHRNACLNEAPGIDFRLGDLLEPVRDERFDLVVANPPYVISPEHTYVFRDAPGRGDDLCRRIVEGLPGVLADGGIAVVLVSWVTADGPPAPLAWAADQGCDVLLLVTQVQPSIDAGLAWNRDRLHDQVDHGERVRRWWAFFDAEGIEALAYGALVLRRRASGRAWTVARPAPMNGPGPAGHQILRLLAAHDVLADAGGALTAAGPLVLATDAEVIHRQRRGAGGMTTAGFEMRLLGGLGTTADLDAEGAAIISAFARPTTAPAAIDRAARALGVSVAALSGDPETLITNALTAGFLEPAG